MSFSENSLNEITCRDLYELLQQGKDPLLLDVREPWEVEIGTILGAYNMPLGFLEERAKELEKTQFIIVICHKGIRSFHALHQLQSLGFTNVLHLKGGLSSWRQQIDSTLADY